MLNSITAFDLTHNFWRKIVGMMWYGKRIGWSNHTSGDKTFLDNENLL
jgi:hypothetical protein